MGRVANVLVLGAGVLAWKMFVPEPAATTAQAHTLEIREEADRIVFAWSGQIEPPMREEFAAAFARFKSDKRRFVVSLNSPGGSIAHGREVVAALRQGAQGRGVETVVAPGGVCASMCVPVFLTGDRRVAAPDAHFMFHAAELDPAATKKAGVELSRLDNTLRSVIETAVTDDLFAQDLQRPRVSAPWLSRLRQRIAGRKLWLSAQQLVDERSGVIDALEPL